MKPCHALYPLQKDSAYIKTYGGHVCNPRFGLEVLHKPDAITYHAEINQTKFVSKLKVKEFVGGHL